MSYYRQPLAPIQVTPDRRRAAAPAQCQDCGAFCRRGDNHACGEHDWESSAPPQSKQLVSTGNGWTVIRWTCVACWTAYKFQTFPGNPEDEYDIDPTPEEWGPVHGWSRCWAVRDDE